MNGSGMGGAGGAASGGSGSAGSGAVRSIASGGKAGSSGMPAPGGRSNQKRPRSKAPRSSLAPAGGYASGGGRRAAAERRAWRRGCRTPLAPQGAPAIPLGARRRARERTAHPRTAPLRRRPRPAQRRVHRAGGPARRALGTTAAAVGHGRSAWRCARRKRRTRALRVPRRGRAGAGGCWAGGQIGARDATGSRRVGGRWCRSPLAAPVLCPCPAAPSWPPPHAPLRSCVGGLISAVLMCGACGGRAWRAGGHAGAVGLPCPPPAPNRQAHFGCSVTQTGAGWRHTGAVRGGDTGGGACGWAHRRRWQGRCKDGGCKGSGGGGCGSGPSAQRAYVWRAHCAPAANATLARAGGRWEGAWRGGPGGAARAAP